jgi:hypothetical protein
VGDHPDRERAVRALPMVIHSVTSSEKAQVEGSALMRLCRERPGIPLAGSPRQNRSAASPAGIASITARTGMRYHCRLNGRHGLCAVAAGCAWTSRQVHARSIGGRWRVHSAGRHPGRAVHPTKGAPRFFCRPMYQVRPVRLLIVRPGTSGSGGTDYRGGDTWRRGTIAHALLGIAEPKPRLSGHLGTHP